MSLSGQDCFGFIMLVVVSLYLLRSMAKPIGRYLTLEAPGEPVGCSHSRQMGLIKRDQTVYYASSARTFFPPRLHCLRLK